MPSLALVQAHQLAQIKNGATASALVLALADELMAGRITSDEFIAAVVGADMLAHQAAVKLALEFVAAFRGEHGVDGVLAEAGFVAGVSYGRAAGVVQDIADARAKIDPGAFDQLLWDAQAWRILEGLAVRSDRAAKMGGRETVMASAEASGRTWRRVSDGHPCSFCAMLVARGNAYTSERSALLVVGRGMDTSANRRKDGTRKRGGQAKGIKPRGKRGMGEQFHNHCGCTVVEVVGQWTPTAQEKRFVKLYNDNAGGSASEVLARMRADPNARGVINDHLVEPRNP